MLKIYFLNKRTNAKKRTNSCIFSNFKSDHRKHNIMLNFLKGFRIGNFKEIIRTIIWYFLGIIKCPYIDIVINYDCAIGKAKQVNSFF